MRSKKVVVRNKNGVHMRVALRVLETISKLDSKVTIRKGAGKADGGSILEMLMLGAEKGSELELEASGGDEQRSIEAVSQVFADGEGI